MAIKPERIFIHHSASAKASTTHADVVRWHVAKGWNGIGYQGTISDAGLYVTGRSEYLPGAHTVNWNARAIAVCVLGNFDSERPSEAALKTLVQVLVAWCRRHKLPASAIYGHRDVNATACPGAHLYAKLGWVRAEVDAYLKADAAGKPRK